MSYEQLAQKNFYHEINQPEEEISLAKAALYLNQEELDKALTMVEMILLVFLSAATEIRDRGLLCFELVKWERARRGLEFYLAMVPNAGYREKLFFQEAKLLNDNLIFLRPED